MRLAVLVRPRRISLTQRGLWAMRTVVPSTKNARAPREARFRSDERLTVGKSGRSSVPPPSAQCLPRLIVSSRVAGRRFSAFAPVSYALARLGPKAGRQAPQQFKTALSRDGQGLQSLGDQQPYHHLEGVNAIVPTLAGVSLKGFEEGSGQQPLIQGKRIGFPCRNWRESESA